MITKCGCYINPDKIKVIGYELIKKEESCGGFFSYKYSYIYTVKFAFVDATYYDSKIEYKNKEDALKDIKEYSKYLPEREK